MLDQSKEERTPDEVINLYEIGKELQVINDDNLLLKFLKVEEIYNQWSDWKKQYNINFSNENL